MGARSFREAVRFLEPAGLAGGFGPEASAALRAVAARFTPCRCVDGPRRDTACVPRYGASGRDGVPRLTAIRRRARLWSYDRLSGRAGRLWRAGRRADLWVRSLRGDLPEQAPGTTLRACCAAGTGGA